MKCLLTSLPFSAAMVVPFILLEVVNRGGPQERFPFVLFIFMSLHSLAIVLLLRPALRRWRSARDVRALSPGHWAGVGLSGLLLFAYVQGIIDQLPCFLGVPNCD